MLEAWLMLVVVLALLCQRYDQSLIGDGTLLVLALLEW